MFNSEVESRPVNRTGMFNAKTLESPTVIWLVAVVDESALVYE